MVLSVNVVADEINHLNVKFLTAKLTGSLQMYLLHCNAGKTASHQVYSSAVDTRATTSAVLVTECCYLYLEAMSSCTCFKYYPSEIKYANLCSENQDEIFA